ncbi:Rv2175c family DNA-binding protein [Cellulomonas fimi]|uniref:Helix-turn-helix domain-containing protein n=1 Tax=Cellulomonas fimi TaxID=1708 RepID=A0A7Y0QGL9_CELFI|nr:Rv2175c family DNA-binding protein [Cellulomonas fimi]NMR19365.1 helix-turn-helix domain-containing protein [Cellulomonas fimi]
MTDIAALDELVDEWLTVPDVADRLGLEAGKVRRLLKEGRLVAVRRGDPQVVSVPAGFLVPAHLENPANSTLRAPAPDPEGEDGAPRAAYAVLSSLAGTVTLLRDAAFDDAETIAWLCTEEESLDGTPLAALRAGQKAAVRRLAQTLL